MKTLATAALSNLRSVWHLATKIRFDDFESFVVVLDGDRTSCKYGFLCLTTTGIEFLCLMMTGAHAITMKCGFVVETEKRGPLWRR
ncbi:hypothetical protein F383_04963 [Gossypium arboreum]|uniref:Uncharacterized protein n=1 Tax=Gossypium arboreum TaxID=29729 RepID=A0A0B0PLW1_GOSAR|nr:hypothetical protein F383_04963 [Gossypium arboreum]